MCAISFGHSLPIKQEIHKMEINDTLLQDLFNQAKACDRKRMNYDLRTSANDNSQRMQNALMPGTSVPVHRHPMSNENVILLCG